MWRGVTRKAPRFWIGCKTGKAACVSPFVIIASSFLVIGPQQTGTLVINSWVISRTTSKRLLCQAVSWVQTRPVIGDFLVNTSRHNRWSSFKCAVEKKEIVSRSKWRPFAVGAANWDNFRKCCCQSDFSWHSFQVGFLWGLVSRTEASRYCRIGPDWRYRCRSQLHHRCQSRTKSWSKRRRMKRRKTKTPDSTTSRMTKRCRRRTTNRPGSPKRSACWSRWLSKKLQIGRRPETFCQKSCFRPIQWYFVRQNSSGRTLCGVI